MLIPTTSVINHFQPTGEWMVAEGLRSTGPLRSGLSKVRLGLKAFDDALLGRVQPYSMRIFDLNFEWLGYLAGMNSTICLNNTTNI